jgi:thioesterase domain-containing protein
VPAADENEEKLMRVFERVLGCEGFSVTDSFFDLGGHSLLVFKLISACAQELHYRPSVTDIFSAPSVRELCARMKTVDRSPYVNLVPLLPSPGKPLIVFVHAASGSAMPFFEVGQHLKADFSIYALQASEVTPGSHEVTLIEQLAAKYTEAVDSIRGLSPLIIASMGGCVALEMARHWRQRGVDIAAILMLDTLLPPKALASADEREAARQAILDLDVLGEEGWALAQIAEASELIARLERSLDANRRAFLEYQPDWFEAEVDYLRATEPFLNEARNFSAVYATPDRGWGKYIQKITVHEVAGHHFNLVAKENAESLAKTLRSIAGTRLTFSFV